MRVIGPLFPPEIQRHVIHAEKLARVLLHIERDAARARQGDAWPIGRASELAAFVADVVADWRRDACAASRAAAALDEYLACLHVGACARVGGTPSCCKDDVTVDAPVAAAARPSPHAAQ